MDTRIVRLPARYGWDADERLDPDEWKVGSKIDRVRSNERYVWFEVDRDGLENLISDADYYSEKPDYADLWGLTTSARAALKVLKATLESWPAAS